ncbi:protein-L-isoaspartate O-methyltransferase [Putridiphycobacter roseus]|uniref:Protein-L-isoaspartate O-methyltransferase n=1 Tax=Putridiphycobacter roseus TaxID=2219161 RepID=A0A2W1NDW7_9FLAO|nr:protein-L-isoaspartate(D-aspartate) O-methyltransferase [Putridiphycobacter roseus]PZE17615.1 protein-L-isoaspartate O-methyltransferase [Putridiphycobacter roseus]
MEDSYKHKGMRKQLVETLQNKGIQNKEVLEAFMVVPRHFFLDKAFTEQAYTNMAFQIGADQTISHPYTVAFQSTMLEISKGDKVLEIGTGSGFQTAILCELGAKVFSIERQKELFLKTRHLLPKLGYSPKLKYGDGYEGWESFAPFDKIIVTCGAPYIPQKLVEQLKPNGKLIIPVGEGSQQEMILITKSSEGEIKQTREGVFSFVPMLKNTAK